MIGGVRVLRSIYGFDYHYSRSPLEITHLLIICGAFWDSGYCGAFAIDTERYASTSPECDGSTD